MIESVTLYPCLIPFFLSTAPCPLSSPSCLAFPCTGPPTSSCLHPARRHIITTSLLCHPMAREHNLQVTSFATASGSSGQEGVLTLPTGPDTMQRCHITAASRPSLPGSFKSVCVCVCMRQRERM